MRNTAALAVSLGFFLGALPPSSPASSQDGPQVMGLFPANQEVCFRGAFTPEPGRSGAERDPIEMTFWSLALPPGLASARAREVPFGYEIALNGRGDKNNVSGICRLDRGATRCAIDCSGGGFTLRWDTPESLMVVNDLGGMALSACGATGPQVSSDWLKAEHGHLSYRLERLSDTACQTFVSARRPRLD